MWNKFETAFCFNSYIIDLKSFLVQYVYCYWIIQKKENIAVHPVNICNISCFVLLVGLTCISTLKYVHNVSRILWTSIFFPSIFVFLVFNQHIIFVYPCIYAFQLKMKPDLRPIRNVAALFPYDVGPVMPGNSVCLRDLICFSGTWSILLVLLLAQ